LDHEHSMHSGLTVVVHTGGLNWATEKNVVESRLARRPGVIEVDANPVAQTATIKIDPRTTSIADLQGWIRDCGLHCAGRSVPNHVCDPMEEVSIAAMPAMEHAGHVMPAAEHAEHEAAPTMTSHDMMGHGGHADMSMDQMVRDMRNRFVVAVIFSIPILLWSAIGREVLGFTASAPFVLRDDVFQFLLSLPVIFYAAWIFFDGAARALRARTLDMMVLVATAIAAGWIYSVVVTFTGGGEVFYEAVSILAAFVLLGHWFEMRARGGANDAIRTLLDLAPPMAEVIRDGDPVEVQTAEVMVGDLLLIRPGSKVPVDAEVMDGASEVDESMVTGESLPVSKDVGSQLIGATINRNGTLRAQATAVGSDTALAQIVQLVQEAQNSKAPGQRLTDRAAFWLVLVALIGGVVTLLAWLASGSSFDTAILFAITVVVVTCPDALGLATPTAIMVGTGLGAKRGILFKNAMALETSASIQAVVMDKTGTLTKGEPEVVEVVAEGIGEEELLRLANAVERESEHPLAEAVVRHAEAVGVPRATATGFESVPGQGARATVDDHLVAVGNQRLMQADRVDIEALAERRAELAASGRTAVIVAIDGRAAGLIAIADAVRPTSRDAVLALRERQIDVVMLTGDNEATARQIAEELGIDHVIAEVLPGDKAARVAELQGEGRKVAMVGRGERCPGTRTGRPRHRDRCRNRRGDRDGRRRAHAIGPDGHPHRADDRWRNAPEDAPEPRLGGGL
jgi:Cu2+-exporting ATPase